MMAGVLSVNHHCTGCGYCLGGLLETAQCPECNKPCAESIAETLAASTKHARRRRRGARLATIGTTGTLVCNIIFILLAEIFTTFPPYTAYLAILWILFISLILATVGWFLVGTRSHEPEHATAPNALRFWMRIACITMLVEFIVFNFLPPTPMLYALLSSTLLRWILSSIPSALYLLTTTAYAVALLKQQSHQSGHTRLRVYFLVLVGCLMTYNTLWGVRLWEDVQSNDMFGPTADFTISAFVLVSHLLMLAAHALVAFKLLRSLGHAHRFNTKPGHAENAA
jgi:hypothetical protein